MGGPALGWSGSAVSTKAALLGWVTVLAPTIALYRRLTVLDRGTAEFVSTLAD